MHRKIKCLLWLPILLGIFAFAAGPSVQAETVDTEALLEEQYQNCIAWSPDGRLLEEEENQPDDSGLKVTDRVSVNAEGFSIDTGLLRLELETKPVPFRWMYFTQDLETEYDKNQDRGVKMALTLYNKDVHLWMINLPSYDVMIEFTEQDLLQLSERWISTDRLDEKMVRIACSYVRAAGWKDVSAVVLGDHRYLVVRDGLEKYGLLLYEAIIEGNNCLLKVHKAPGSPLEQEDIALAESVIDKFVISVSARRQEP